MTNVRTKQTIKVILTGHQIKDRQSDIQFKNFPQISATKVDHGKINVLLINAAGRFQCVKVATDYMHQMNISVMLVQDPTAHSKVGTERTHDYLHLSPPLPFLLAHLSVCVLRPS